MRTRMVLLQAVALVVLAVVLATTIAGLQLQALLAHPAFKEPVGLAPPLPLDDQTRHGLLSLEVVVVVVVV